MKNIVIVTPHPDDETLGCGGTILKYIEQLRLRSELDKLKAEKSGEKV